MPGSTWQRPLSVRAEGKPGSKYNIAFHSNTFSRQRQTTEAGEPLFAFSSLSSLPEKRPMKERGGRHALARRWPLVR